MSRPIEALGRLLMAGIFIHGGWAAFKEPAGRAQKAAKLGFPEPELAVKANGLTMVVAGTALGIGIKPKLAAVALAGSLVPTTLAGHPFWEEKTPEARNTQLTQFLKNLGLMGGLLFVITRRR